MTVGITIAEAAHQRVLALTSLARSPEREELRAAGVPERTIDALCPVTFAEIVPSLIDLLSGDYLAQVAPYEGWEKVGVRLITKIRRVFSSGATAQQQLEFDTSFCATDCYRALMSHLFENLPGRQHRGRANTVVHALWLVHWVGSDPILRAELAHELTLLTDWVTPQLISQVALLTRGETVSEVQFVLA